MDTLTFTPRPRGAGFPLAIRSAGPATFACAVAAEMWEWSPMRGRDRFY